MSLTEEMAEDFKQIEVFARKARLAVEQENDEKAKEKLEEIEELAKTWE